MKIKFIIIIFLLLSQLINSTDFGKTTIKLSQISGGTVKLLLFSENGGETSGSDLTILNLLIECNSIDYPLTCPTNKQHTLIAQEGYPIQCQISGSISSSTTCFLKGAPTILSTGDTFNSALENAVTSEESKFGDTKINILSVEGKKVMIKIIPQRTDETSSNDLFIYGLTVQSKELTCKATAILTLQANTGTNLECSTTEEIDGNINCKLGGNPFILSTGDSFGKISYGTNSVVSSFGQVKIGLVSVKGTTVTIILKSEYPGNVNVAITGLKINDEKVINCPEKNIDINNSGVEMVCTISQAMEDNASCELTQMNLQCDAFSNLIIDETKKTCIAGSSKYGKSKILLQSVIGTSIKILIKTTLTAETESNEFKILGLNLNSDNRDYPMTCRYSAKLNLKSEGTDFLCTITTKINGGKICSLTGVPNYVSEGDTFSDITVETETVVSSFGGIKITPVSIIGNIAKVKLISDYPGTTLSSVVSIDGLKWNEETLTCLVGNNINFSNKPEISCTLGNTMGGNIKAKLLGATPSINMGADSLDMFGSISLDTNEIISSCGQLRVSLDSVIGDKVTINLESDYVVSLTNLNINNLKLNNKYLSCNSGSVSLDLKKTDGTSDAKIECKFSDTSYSEETGNSCTLTGNPSASLNLFTTQIITSPYQKTSGTRNFGDIIIYLDSIKGTTVYIKLKSSNVNGKVRPKISNLKLQAGSSSTTLYDVQCDITDKIQLYKNSETKVKCYIPKTINTNTACKLVNQDNNVRITADNGDQFGNAIIDTSTINVKPSSSTYDSTSIELVEIIGNEITIDITVSTTTIINTGNPVVHNLYLGETELYCVASQTLTFTNNKAQMKCTSSTEISCSPCHLTGNPTIVSLGDSDDTFGETSIHEKSVNPTTSTLGDINIKLNEVVGTDVYISVSSVNNGRNKQQVDINNLYIDGQPLTCSDNFQFSTTPTKIKCTIQEPLPYNKPVELTGTPSIKIYSDEESIGVVGITESGEITSKSNSGLNIKLISVKENYVIISIDAFDLTRKTFLENFNLNGLTINDIPFEINLDNIYLGGGPIEVKGYLTEPIDTNTLCELKGTSTAQATADGKIFGPISNPTLNKVYSTVYKFGNATLSLLKVQGYTTKLKIYTTKSALTLNTILNDIYINNIHLTCNFNDNIELSSYGTEIECELASPINGNILCTLSYKGNGDDNFENILIDEEHKTVTSEYKNFGYAIISLISVNVKNVKIKVKTQYSETTSTNNFKINNLYINNKKIKCEINNKIKLSPEGAELDCTMDDINENTETYTLTAIEPEIISFADNFNDITIDPVNYFVRTEPKTVDELTIMLSSVAENKASIKIKVTNEIYTRMKILNLKIKNRQDSTEYSLTCPKKYVNLIERNEYSNYIICDISTSTKIPQGISFILVNDDQVSIDSYDNFERIKISTNEVISTKFGDIILNYVSSQIIIDVIPTNQETTLGPLYIDKLKLLSSSQFKLNCYTQETIELKSSGTKLYCSIDGSLSLASENNNIDPILESNYVSDSFGNILLENNFYEMQSTNCYTIFDRTSCEINPKCIYSKESFGFCDNKYNIITDEENISLNNNNMGCILYINEDKCNENNNCFWNEENKYTCKSKEIKNCERLLLNTDILKCETCETGYELNSDSTKCILVGEAYYPCSEYSSYTSCTSKPQCEYHDEPFNYCDKNNDDEDNEDNNCNLYITREACNEQEYCIWKTKSQPGCNEKYIENCIKLKESNPTTCEKCEDGYYLLGGTSCTRKSLGENDQCEKLIDDKENCEALPFCEYSRNAFCYGGDGCYRYLTQELCERSELCWWNSGNWNRCKIKQISNCLELGEDDATTCAKCKNGYALREYNTVCYKTTIEFSEEDISLCSYYSDQEYECNEKEICHYSNRNRCEGYNENTQCILYLDKNLCEEDQRCYWITNEEARCQVMGINNCLELNSENVRKCKRCKNGFELSNENSECISSGSGFINININLITFAFALVLLL